MPTEVIARTHRAAHPARPASGTPVTSAVSIAPVSRPAAPPAPAPARRAHPDAPDTRTGFRLLVTLPDGPQRERVRDEVLRAWLPMAYRIAGSFRDKGESLEDLRQVAALGLVKAIRRFDPARGPFEPFAIPTIRGELRRHFRDRMWDVRVPRRVQDLRNKVRAAGVEPALTEADRLTAGSGRLTVGSGR